MMAKFYMTKFSKGNLPSGAIIKIENRKIIALEFKIEFNYDDFAIPRDWIELTELKRKYLQEIDLKRRLNVYDKQIFEKICILKENDQCFITIKNESRSKYFIKQIKKREINVVKMDGRERIISMYNIDNIEMINYYICVAKYKSVEPGMIIIDCDGIMKIYPNGYPVSSKENLEKISEEESKFLYKYPCNERLTMYTDKIWKKITKLTINSHCYIATDPSGSLYKIIEKSRTQEGVKYMLQGKDNQSIIVDETDIRAERILPSQSSDATMTSTRVYYNYPRQSSLNINQSILCTNNIVSIIKLSSIQDIEAGETINKVMKLKQDSMTLIVTLKWKGRITGRMCIGCELNKDCIYGTDGTFNGKQLFHCIDHRGVLIELNDTVTCCESGNGRASLREKKHNDIRYVKNIFIDEKCICCAEIKEDSYYKIGKQITVMDNVGAIIKWTGLINGEECVGLETIDDPSGTDPPFTVMPLFKSRSGHGIVVRSKDIFRNIRPTNDNLSIIKISNIQTMETEENHNKIISLKKGSSSFIATLKWKGRVNGKKCIGCELYNESNIGTDGTFHGKQLFHCINNRGVLIELDDTVTCCESGNGEALPKEKKHNDIIYTKHIFIDETCICCAETKKVIMSAPHMKIDDPIIVMDNLSGIIKWIGLINGEECVGVETNGARTRTDPPFKEIPLFITRPNSGIVVKVKDIKTDLECLNNKLTIVNPTNIQIINDGHSMNRILVLKTTTPSYRIVKLKWKGEVNGKMCLGCELYKYCIYGSKGIFKEEQLFHCPDKRGVLLQLNVYFDCCERWPPEAIEHNTIKITEFVFIDEKCICCAESKDALLTAPSMKIDKRIIFVDNYSGVIKWMGLINGVECIGIETNDYKNGTDGTFNGIKLFQCRPNNGVLVAIKDIPLRIFCEQIYANIVNHTMIKMIEEKSPFFKYMILDNNGKVSYLEVIWQGMVDERECFGCVLPLEYKFGTNGIFNGQSLFTCDSGRGILLEIGELSMRCRSGNTHKSFLTETFIEEESICCIEPVCEFNLKPLITIGRRIFIKSGNQKMKSQCLWIGKVNGIECVGLEIVFASKVRADGIFNGVKLFDCKRGKGVLCQLEDVEMVPRFELVRELYLRNDHKITECERINGPNQYKLMRILDDPPIYGRVLFTIYEQYFTAIRLKPEYVKNNLDKLKDIIFKDEEYMALVVISSKVELFHDNLEEDRNIIVMDSIKVIDKSKPNLFEEKDIVKYLREDEICYGKVEQVTILNGVRCLRIIKTIIVGKEDEPVFIRESVATKLVDKDIKSKFIKGVIYELHSIVTFSESNMNNIGRNDEVEFQLRGEWEIYKGKVLLTALANNEPCAVVELYMTLKDVDLNLCHVRRWTAFKDLYKYGQNIVFIISSCVLRVIDKKIFKCYNNNVFVLDPNKVESVNEISKEEKIIIFKCNDDVIIARLRWTGSIDNELFIGCEMSRNCKYGTNGTFTDNVLFHSDEGHGVLIPLDRIKDCCVKRPNTGIISSIISMVVPSHRSLNEPIVGSSICCVQTMEILSKKSQLQVGGRVMHVDKRVYGVCRWIGLVNGREVIGVEMTHGSERNKDELINKLAIFNNMRLFIADDFVIDTIGLCYCPSNDVTIIDHHAIERVENGNMVDKTIIYYNREKKLNIKWRGVINGALCVGCELTSECECRTNGFFGDTKLFDCAPRRGVLIPSDSLTNSCESSTHKEINKQQYNAINPTSICCFEEIKKFTKGKQMDIGSKIKFKPGMFSSEKFGKCKWLGLVNGEDSVGVKMKQSITNGTNGRFGFVDLFSCKEGLGLLFLADDIDYVEEKQHFYVDKLFNRTKILKVLVHKIGDIGFTIGDYVSINIENDNNELQIWYGEVKWKGLVNKDKCVGVDLEKEYTKGSNGVLNDKVKFECDPDHGLVIVVDHVNKVDNLVLPFTIDGIIDPERYLKLEPNWHKHFLQEKNVSKDGMVTVKIDNDGGVLRMNGKLRWSGIMNGEEVAVVELDREYEYGTNGRFWRESILKCDNYRAIAVPWKNIYKYIPYQGLAIPPDKRIFKDLDVNSAVIYYFPKFGKLEPLYGTIRWSGVNEQGEFIFGIDLDDRFNGGTDGLFNGHRLFRCNDGHGVLASINNVVPDTRFTELNYQDVDIKESQKSENFQFATPIKRHRGENFGIQGNANSCYFDSSIFALFSKSDVLDFLIAPLFNAKEPDDITKEFRKVMAWEIVYPLREFGFVSFHNTKKMREIIKEYGGKFLEMTKQETDMENVASLLMKLCPNNQLLSLRTFSGHVNNSMFLQLFVILQKSLTNITSQQMLEISMAQNDIMFNVPPTCLIMQAPRDANGINCYSNVLPSKTIEISNLCYPCYKQCHKCSQQAVWQCKECIEKSNTIKKVLTCDNHKCLRHDVSKLPQSPIQSKLEVQMILKAIICIDKAHFVTYVKEDQFKNEWVFFDSMSTQNIANNYAVPKVSFERDVSHFLNMNEEDMAKELQSYKSDKLKRIAKDSYIFVYHNTTQTCY